MPLADYLPWNVSEARKNKGKPAALPATAQPAPDRLPNRAGFVQGVPPHGFDEDAASSSTGAAQNTNRSDFLQELWEEYLRCPWSFSSVNAIARTVTAGGLVMKWDADTGQFGQKQPDKPREVLAFERLLAFCNPTQDIRQLCRNIVADLQVFADAYVEVVWFAGIPVALYNQDCPTTFPKTDPHGNVTQYVQVTEDGRRVTFRPEQIIHFTLDSARPSIFGVSPTHAAEESIVAWMYLHACEKEAARRGLPPNVHVDHPAGTPDTEVEKWQNKYAARNIGPANIGTPITTKGGGKVNELQTAKLTDILAAKKEARDEIVCSYGVPPAKLGIIESGNLGGGTGADQNKTFMLDVIKPIANLIAEKLQYNLAVKAFGVRNWHVEFPTTDYRDDKMIADIQDQQVRLGGLTLNKLRADLGQPPVEGGDDAVLIARQDIILWSDLAARSAASVEALRGGLPGDGDSGDMTRPLHLPGPPPAAGTGPSKGLGGGKGSKNAGAPRETAAIAEAVVYYLREAGIVGEHTAKLSTRQRVYNQLRKNFTPSALTWVLDHDVTRSWDGPLRVPASQVDRDDEDEWNAVIDRAKVARIKKRYRKTGKIRPSVLVRVPGKDKDIVVDGHHHALASMEMGHPVTAYVAHVTSDKGPWRTLSLRQHNTANKASKAATRESLPNRERISKARAGYQEAAELAVSCGTCVMFHDDRCDLVEGNIDPGYTCTQWEAEAKPASTGSAA